MSTNRCLIKLSIPFGKRANQSTLFCLKEGWVAGFLIFGLIMVVLMLVTPSSTVSAKWQTIKVMSSHPAVMVSKTGHLNLPYDIITYNIEITNPVGHELYLQRVTDTLHGDLTDIARQNGCDVIGVYESCRFSANARYDFSGIQISTISVEFQAYKEDGSLTTVFDSYDAIFLGPVLSIEVEKSGPSEARPGDVVYYLFTVRNTGTLVLHTITASDNVLGDLFDKYGFICDGLAPGNSCSISIPHTVPLDTKENPYTNTVTACGIAYARHSTCNTATHELDLIIPTGDQGCSHGYWKNHTSRWAGYTPGQTLNTIFSVPAAYSHENYTLERALRNPGGSGEAGGARILLRTAAGALLNASHPQVSYPLTKTEVIQKVNSALASDNRKMMLGLAGQLNQYNNLGCPLRK